MRNTSYTNSNTINSHYVAKNAVTFSRDKKVLNNAIHQRECKVINLAVITYDIKKPLLHACTETNGQKTQTTGNDDQKHVNQ